MSAFSLRYHCTDTLQYICYVKSTIVLSAEARRERDRDEAETKAEAETRSRAERRREKKQRREAEQSKTGGVRCNERETREQESLAESVPF